ncbi:MAG: phytoene desaturase family protein, partial [Nocardioidaceae bacterium]
PPEVVVHAKDATLLLRTGGTAPPGAAAWTILGRGRLPDDLVGALAGAGLRGVRRLIETRIDLSPGEQLEQWGGSPYGVLWQGRSTVRDRLPTRTPYAGVYCAGASVAATTGLPFVGLTAAVVAEQIGPA